MIPENFISEIKIIGGMFRLRYFMEGCFMGLLFAWPVLILPIANLEARITMLIFAGGIPFMLGVMGIMGDPVSVFLCNMLHWFRNRQKYYYDPSVRPLESSPMSLRGKTDELRENVSLLQIKIKEKKEEILKKNQPGIEHTVLEEREIQNLIVRKVTEKPENILGYLENFEEELP